MSKAPVVAGAIAGPLGGLIMGGLYVVSAEQTWEKSGNAGSPDMLEVAMCDPGTVATQSGELTCYNTMGSTLFGTVGQFDPGAAGSVLAVIVALIVGGIVAVVEESKPRPTGPD